MGHRSSKSSAGSTNGNTTITNKSLKSNKHLKHRSVHSKSLILENSVTVCTDNNLESSIEQQFEDGALVDAADLTDFISSNNSDQSVANSQSGRIIIKIQFRRRLSRMENKQNRKSQQLQAAESAFAGSGYRHITDSNSNQLPHVGEQSVLNVTLNQNFVLDGPLNCAQQCSATETTRSGAAGGSRNSLLNNNIESVIGCTSINELHISEPLVGVNGAGDVAEYCEVLEEPSGSSANKQAHKHMNVLATNDDYTRRQKSKSGFMSLKNILEPSASKSHRNRESQQSQSQANNNHEHSQDIRSHQVSVLSVPLTHSKTIATSSLSNIAALTTPTPISITTSAAASSATLPANSTNGLVPGQVSIWGTHSGTGVIIPLNSQVVVVCPHKSVLTLGSVNDDDIRFMAEIVGSSTDRDSTNHLTTAQSNMTQPQSFLVKSTHNGPIVHSQVDFVHCLVPDLERIMNSSFYWGKMDRYEAERLLEGKTEGTFLLRDSAQEEYLFSVTFRKYGRSLHARIEQSGHKFSFDSHDQCVFTAPTVTGLLEHYKDPACVMFFEPMLTIPFHRKTAFSLQELARATIVSHTTYDGINQLELPVRLKAYLKEYHYKQKLRVKPFDDSLLSCT